MTKKFLADEAWDGTQTITHFDSDGNLTDVQMTNDVEPVIEENKLKQTDGNKGYGDSRELQHIASVPVGVLMQYCQEKGIPLQHALGGREQTDIILKMIKDPDYRYLRTDI